MSSGTTHSVILGSNLVSFLPGISPEERSRVLDCLLYAELHSGKSADRKSEWHRWVHSYQESLSVGFERTSPRSSHEVKVSNRKDFEREATKIVKTIASQGLAHAAQTTLDAMFKSPAAQSFFRDWFNFSSSRSDSFQIIPCQKNSSGRIEIAVCGMQMTTRMKLRISRWWPFSYEMTLSLRGGNFNFDNAKYVSYEAHIEQVLRDSSADYLEQIAL